MGGRGKKNPPGRAEIDTLYALCFHWAAMSAKATWPTASASAMVVVALAVVVAAAAFDYGVITIAMDGVRAP